MANFVFTQYGGSSGGSAGDACLIQLGDNNLVIDFGVEQQRTWLESDLGRAKYSAVVTHFHTDHCGTPKLRNGAEELWVNPTSLMAAHASALEAMNCEKGTNDRVIWKPKDGALDVSVWFIEGPGTEDHLQTENAHSAGVYGRVSHKDKVVFRWLLLGDMVSEAWENIDAVLPAGKVLDYIKLPHHGSPNNHMDDLFKDYVGRNTRLVTSGYNNVDAAWVKIKLANSKVEMDQMNILTHHRKNAPGSRWGDYQKKWLELTIDQSGSLSWRHGAPDPSLYG